jgi:hypothetical protein
MVHGEDRHRHSQRGAGSSTAAIVHLFDGGRTACMRYSWWRSGSGCGVVIRSACAGWMPTSALSSVQAAETPIDQASGSASRDILLSL